MLILKSYLSSSVLITLNEKSNIQFCETIVIVCVTVLKERTWNLKFWRTLSALEKIQPLKTYPLLMHRDHNIPCLEYLGSQRKTLNHCCTFRNLPDRKKSLNVIRLCHKVLWIFVQLQLPQRIAIVVVKTASLKWEQPNFATNVAYFIPQPQLNFVQNVGKGEFSMFKFFDEL